MLLIPLFHRVGKGKYATCLSVLKESLVQMQRYPLILPGEKMERSVQLCLTFDDATCDFYHFIFPLLKELKMRALLGVPTHWILNKSDMPWEKRLDFTDPFASAHHFCTQDELKEMVESGWVELASHSHTHRDMTTLSGGDLEEELVKPLEILENFLGKKPTTLIYPYGKMDPRVQRVASKHYPYCMRIGNAANFSWSSLLYRIPMDGGGRVRANPLQILKFFTNRLRSR